MHEEIEQKSCSSVGSIKYKEGTVVMGRERYYREGINKSSSFSMATGGKQYITWKDNITDRKVTYFKWFYKGYIEQKLKKAFHLYIFFFFFTIVYKSENYAAYTSRII